MMGADIFKISQDDCGLSLYEIADAVRNSLNGTSTKKALIIPPDFTRLHSNAGLLTRLYYEYLTAAGSEVDILPALGTHTPLTKEQADVMFPGIPFDKFLVHDWRSDVVKIGQVPVSYISEITEGLWNAPVDVEVNRLIMDESYDLIISPGQVVPHEVIGMSNHSKNFFVGVGGASMINSTHMIGAVYGMERMMGRDHTPVRKLLDYAFEHFLSSRPILFALTVTTAPGGNIVTHGLFIGRGRECLNRAVALAKEKNIFFLEKAVRKCVVFLDPNEFKSTWLGNKAIYRTRMAIADGGELIVLAPGVERFGEDMAVDALIRKYGYSGRLSILEQFKKPESTDLRANMSAAAHLIHGSSDGRFSVTYAVDKISQKDIRSVGFGAADYKETVSKYDPAFLKEGFNTINGEEIFYISNPALGLWINKESFEKAEDRA